MLRFRKLKNFLSLFVSAYLYVILLPKLVFIPNLLPIVFAVKVRCQIHPIHFISPSMEIVPHLQRELVVYKGNLTGYHLSFLLKHVSLNC